jgi:hypothetical protein
MNREAQERSTIRLMRDVGALLAGCGLLLVGLAAMIFVLRGDSQRDHQLMSDEAFRQGMRMTLDEFRRRHSGVETERSDPVP